MNFQHFHRFLFVIGFLLIGFVMQAQSVKELETQRKKTLQMLESTNKMLNETKKSQRSSLNKLNIINKNISVRKNLISSIGVEINALDNEVGRLGQEKRLLENRLSNLKKDYAKLVQEAHINRSVYAKIMFVLSAESFDQSYRRFRYVKEYTDYRKEQVRKIEKVRTDIVSKTDSLNENKNTKADVVKQKEIETNNLSKDQSKEKFLLTDLQKKEKKLRDDLKIQQRKANDLDNKIARIIAEEIRKAEEARKAEIARRAEITRKAEEALKAEEARKRQLGQDKKQPSKPTEKQDTQVTKPKPITSTSTSAVSALTKEETLISGNFSANSGRLPWPTDKGFISGKYGVHPHPVLTHVTTNNKGIYIQTPAGTNARAVFEGEVTQRFSIPGSNNAVIVKHGDYRTVYANLTNIYVNVGDKISAKQSIGRIYTDGDNDNKTELYFQIYKGRTLLNPESWIAR